MLRGPNSPLRPAIALLADPVARSPFGPIPQHGGRLPNRNVAGQVVDGGQKPHLAFVRRVDQAGIDRRVERSAKRCQLDRGPKIAGLQSLPLGYLFERSVLIGTDRF